MSLMIESDEANEAYTAAHAIAGFQLADLAFGVLVRNGILPKSDAERLLKQAIAANRTGDPGHQAAVPEPRRHRLNQPLQHYQRSRQTQNCYSEKYLLLALMESANRGLITRAGSMSQ
jgi:hypothetical protein